MARPRKPYNPNTAYGRRKLREAHAERMANMPESDRKEIENNATGCFVLFLIIGGLIIYLLFGGEGVLRWLGGKRPY